MIYEQLFGDLAVDDVFITPVLPEDIQSPIAYFLWRKEEGETASIYYVPAHTEDSIAWKTGDAYRRNQGWPPDTRVIKISTQWPASLPPQAEVG